MKLRIFLIGLLVLGIASTVFAAPRIMVLVSQYSRERDNARTLAALRPEDHIIAPSASGSTTEAVIDESAPLPTRAYLDVPFTPQAPFANWNIHEESCEEAALLQVRYYLTNTDLTATQADADIQDMIEWQKTTWGTHADLFADDMKKFIMGYYGYTDDEVIIIRKATLDQLKREIVRGNPIIAPITGNLLNNPWYHYPGYHMLTIIGYTEDRIITNDVGTKRGKDFSYEYDRFMKAMRDASGDVIIIVPRAHESIS